MIKQISRMCVSIALLVTLLCTATAAFQVPNWAVANAYMECPESSQDMSNFITGLREADCSARYFPGEDEIWSQCCNGDETPANVVLVFCYWGY